MYGTTLHACVRVYACAHVLGSGAASMHVMFTDVSPPRGGFILPENLVQV